MKAFELHEPSTLKEAISLLVQFGAEAKVLAGGTDLLVKMKRRKIAPAYVISLKKIPALNSIRYDNATGLTIGAVTSLNTISSSKVVQDEYPVLIDSIKNIGSPQIQNMATIGGNICNASPSADTVPPLIALNSVVKIVAPGGEKRIALEDFFVGPGETVLEKDEILVEIQVPKIPASTRAVYLKHGIRQAMEIAVVGVAVALDLDRRTYFCNEVKVVMGAVAPTPIRSRSAEGILRGNKLGEGIIERAAAAAALDAKPISDVRSSKDYRLEIVKVLVERGIKRAMAEDDQKLSGQ